MSLSFPAAFSLSDNGVFANSTPSYFNSIGCSLSGDDEFVPLFTRGRVMMDDGALTG
eukprot:CAMPEP_0204615254 /NCGR_PEP_ID=MMETSP0717-20131115/2793_1 /ASSEMBLY_ACC=CAM_ASM_000666 /TAXON_ID=230516 /ORGANISM="Chaetoceros curvisetus" /LENGTH=56 /DNA_ID=CAMNT_0051628141 /DNA_START=268 /DNA_END=434 /DNA_ORIENTATION=-